MQMLLSIFQVLIAIALISIILVQRGKGAAAGSGFGAGASGTVFGARGAASFLTRTTAILAVAFLGVTFAMAMYTAKTVRSDDDLGLMADIPETQLPAEQTTDTTIPNLETNAISNEEVPVLDDAEAVVEEVAESIPDAIDAEQQPDDTDPADQ